MVYTIIKFLDKKYMSIFTISKETYKQDLTVDAECKSLYGESLHHLN